MKHEPFHDESRLSSPVKDRHDDEANSPMLRPTVKVEEEKSVFSLLLFITFLFAFEGFTTSLFGNTIPIILAEKRAGYTATGIITLTQLPFCLKFLIAPFIDTYYIQWLGRRKTYLSISTVLTGIIFVVVSPRLTKMMKESDISDLFWVGFVSSFVTAIYVLLLSYCGQLIKDVALQGWIIKVVPPEHFSAVSSTQLIGTTIGQIFGFYGLMPLTAKEFLNIPQVPIVMLHDVTFGFGVFVTAFSVIWFFIQEKESPEELRLKGDLQRTFMTFKGFIKNPNLRTYILVLMGQNLGFGTIEAVFRYVLVKKGYSKEEFTIVNGYLTPLLMLGTTLAHKFTSVHTELTVYLFGKIIRLFKFLYMVWFVYAYDNMQSRTIVFLGVNFALALKNIESSIRRTAIITFDYRIAERAISGTYLAILVSIVNLMIVLSDGLYPIVLDYVDLSIMVSAGTVYNIAFLTLTWKILMDFQSKDSEEFSVLKYIEEAQEAKQN